MGFRLRDSSNGERRKGYVEHKTAIEDLVRPSVRAKLDKLAGRKNAQR